MTSPSPDLGWLDNMGVRRYVPTQVFKMQHVNDGRPYVVTPDNRPDPYLYQEVRQEKKEEESFESIMTLLLGG